MPKIVVIPDKTPDLRSCGTRRWGAGVDLQVSTLRLRPVSVVRDGAEGAFMLTTVVNASYNEIELRLHHVNAAGVPSTSVVLSTFSNVWYYDAFLVPSATGSCIAVWTAGGWGNMILAQRFDTNLATLWPAPVALSPTNHGINYSAAASDAAGGAFVAFQDNGNAGVAVPSFRVQRVTANGSLPWGTTGTTLVSPGTSSQSPFASPQIAVGPTEFAVVWQGWHGGPGQPSVFGTWLDFNGVVLNGPFSLGTSAELIGLSHKWVAADPGGGFYVALQPPLASLTLARFDSLAITPRWTAPTQVPAGAGTYALAEDGSGGALLATLGTGGLITVACFNVAGLNKWAPAAAANAATVAVLSVPAPGGPLTMAGSMALAAKTTGGAILVFSDWQQPAAPRLHSQCFDGNGAFFGKSSDVPGVAGAQSMPLVCDMVVPAVIPTLVKPNFGGKFTSIDPEKDSIICIWQGRSGVSGTSITAQKLGCCKTHYNGTVVVVPDFGCAVPIDWPTNLPGTLNAIFPCGNPKGTFGLLPVPQLALVPGANLPGGLATASVPPPDWVRIWFEHVPPNVTIEMRSHTNKVVASAVTLILPQGVAQQHGQIATLTFRPSAKLSYVLVFNRPHEGDMPPVVPLGLRMEFGSGEAPPVSLPLTGPRARPDGARSAAPIGGRAKKQGVQKNAKERRRR